MAAQDYKSP